MYMVPACQVRRVSRGLTWRFFFKAGILLGLFLILVQTMTGFEMLSACQKAAGNMPEVIISKLYQHKHLSILSSMIPVLGWSNLAQDAPGGLPDQIYRHFISGIVPVNPFDPPSVLMSQVPVLALKSRPEAVVVSRSGAAQPGDTAPLAQASPLPGETLVLIYNTHSGETYSLTDRVERLDGRQGGVVTAAAALQEALESKHGIKAARSDRIHDLEYNTSYLKSEKTAREMLAASPKAMAVFDIHRDAAKTRKQSVVRVNGQDVAPLLFIIGSGARKPLVNGWRQNYTFATKLSIKANELYPGLSLGVRVKEGQYNQFLHPHAVLMEIGTSNNSTEEAVRSAVLFADVLAQALKE